MTLAKTPGESKLARNRDIARKLRGMAILFQEEMRLDARPSGEAPPQLSHQRAKSNIVPPSKKNHESP